MEWLNVEWSTSSDNVVVPSDCTLPSVMPIILVIFSVSIRVSERREDDFITEISACESNRNVVVCLVCEAGIMT